MELYTHEQMLDKHIGKVGTRRRDKFDEDVRKAVEEYCLGEAVKNARVSQHLTQEELGERVGVRAARISKIEKGNGINLSSLIRIFKALGAESGTLDLGSMGRVALW